MNGVIGGTEKAEIVYEVRNDTGETAVERKDCRKQVLQFYSCKTSLLFLMGKLSCLGWKYLLWIVVSLFLAVYCVFQYIYKAFILYINLWQTCTKQQKILSIKSLAMMMCVHPDLAWYFLLQKIDADPHI